MKTNITKNTAADNVLNQESNENNQCYRLVASAHRGKAIIYGQALTEICNKTYREIALIKDPCKKAYEQERYASFLLDNFERFIAKKQILSLVKSLIDDAQLNLKATHRSNESKYNVLTVLKNTKEKYNKIKLDYFNSSH